MTNLPTARPPSAILEAALYAEDLETCAAFYRDVMGLTELTRVEGRHVFFRLDTIILLLFHPTATAEGSANPALPVPAHGATGPGHLCFTTDRAALDPWLDRLEAAGVAVEADFEWPNGARSIYFRDPAGNSLELAEPKLWFDD